jgi:hypothetical protein
MQERIGPDLRVIMQIECSYCGGDGWEWVCDECGGTGLSRDGEEACEECDGDGGEICPMCNGTGWE